MQDVLWSWKDSFYRCLVLLRDPYRDFVPGNSGLAEKRHEDRLTGRLTGPPGLSVAGHTENRPLPGIRRALFAAVVVFCAAASGTEPGQDMPAVKSNVPVSTLIVDDEELARNLVGALVRRDPDLMLIGECSDGAAALDFVATSSPELVFLDIHMPVLDGLAVAERLVAYDDVPYIVFVTAFDEHAIRAFELNALDYLVKPIEKRRFRAAVQRATTAIRNKEMLSLTERLLQLAELRKNGRSADSRQDQELVVRAGESIVQLRTGEITWIEAANQYVHIHTASRTFTVAESLSQYAKRIADPRFFRIHRSAIVNGSAVATVAKKRNGTHMLRLHDGKSLVVARSRASIIPNILRAARSSDV